MVELRLEHIKPALDYGSFLNMKHQYKHGQSLVTLLVFMIIGITITSAAVVMTITNSQNATKFQEGMIAFQVAESGAENAIIRLLRDPNYTGETLAIGGGTAVITVSGTTTKTIVSAGTNGNYYRKVQVIAGYVNNLLTITSWQEVY